MEIIFLDTLEAKQIISRLLITPPVVLVGSGVSGWEPTCLPMGKNFTKDMFDFLFPLSFLENNPNLTDSLSILWRDVPFENLNGSCHDYQKLALIIKNAYAIDTPNSIHKIIAQALISGKFYGIVTTNYDLCLDKLFSEEQRIKRIVTEFEFKSIDSISEKVYFKIHGSADDKKGETLFYALSQESCLKGWKRELLLNMIKERSLLITGYSGLDFEICPEILKMPVKNVIWNVNGDTDTFANIENKLSPNARIFLKEMPGYFLVGDMRTLFSLLTNSLVPMDLKRGEPSNNLLDSIKDEFKEYEISIWRASLLNKIGCASLAYKACEEALYMHSPKKIYSIALRRQRAQSLFHIGKHYQSAKEFHKLAEESNSLPSLRIALLLESCDAYRVYGGFLRSIFYLIIAEKEIYKITECEELQELSGRCALKEVLILNHLLEITKRLNVKFAKYFFRERAIILLQIASKNAVTTGNWFDFQQTRLWADKMKIDPLILEHDLTYGPPPNKEGYEHLGYHVAQSMHSRYQLSRETRSLSLEEELTVKKHMENSLKFRNCPEVWKLSYICLKRKGSGDKSRITKLFFNSLFSCEYSILRKFHIFLMIIKILPILIIIYLKRFLQYVM